MARKQELTHDESIQDNLDKWCLEVGTVFEGHSVKAANKFLEYIKNSPVVDLGSGDGAGTNVFVKNGNPTTAVDINPEKLINIKGAKLQLTDFLGYLKKPVDNVFCHHALEHYVDYEKVLEAIGKWLKKGSYCYIAVPKNDEPHSVHHVAFDSHKELIPPKTEIIEYGESDDMSWPEYYVIVRKI